MGKVGCGSCEEIMIQVGSYKGKVSLKFYLCLDLLNICLFGGDAFKNSLKRTVRILDSG